MSEPYVNSQEYLKRDGDKRKMESDKRELVQRMRAAFIVYGPAWQTYSDTAMHNGIASILVHFGINKDPCDTLAQTLATQVRRSSVLTVLCSTAIVAHTHCLQAVAVFLQAIAE